MMLAPISSRCWAVNAFTAPCVPTGMNTGVSMTPCAVCKIPRRAPPSVYVSVNKKIPGPLLSLSDKIASWDHFWRALRRARGVRDVSGVDLQAYRSRQVRTDRDFDREGRPLDLTRSAADGNVG